MLCVKAKHAAHATTLEANAYVLWLKWLLRSGARHSKRVVCLVDSKAVIGGCTKGRSSAPGLQKQLRQAAVVTLAGDILPRLVYVPSGDNTADEPSRRQRRSTNTLHYYRL